MLDEVIAGTEQVIGTGIAGCTLLLGLAFALATHRHLAQRLGWSRWPTLGALAFGMPIVALTLMPLGPIEPMGVARFRLHHFLVEARHLPWHHFDGLGANAERLANLALYVPAAFFLTVACRRVWPAVLLGPAVSLLAELVQSFDSWRSPDPQDLVHNALGAWIGAVAGLLVTVSRISVERVQSRVYPEADRNLNTFEKGVGGGHQGLDVPGLSGDQHRADHLGRQHALPQRAGVSGGGLLR
ncbi:VanZ family protein [Phytohabitans rumicis]|nr:VanZ family protein [Phytohabitans rumicis]